MHLHTVRTTFFVCVHTLLNLRFICCMLDYLNSSQPTSSKARLRPLGRLFGTSASAVGMFSLFDRSKRVISLSLSFQTIYWHSENGEETTHGCSIHRWYPTGFAISSILLANDFNAASSGTYTKTCSSTTDRPFCLSTRHIHNLGLKDPNDKKRTVRTVYIPPILPFAFLPTLFHHHL